MGSPRAPALAVGMSQDPSPPLEAIGGQQAKRKGGGDGQSHLHRVMGALAIWHSNCISNQPD